MTKGGTLAWGIGGFAVLFGLMTLAAGGPVVLDLGTARADHGSYVPFVLYFNVASALAYLAAGVGVALERRWAAKLAAAITVGLAVTGAGLAIHIFTGGAYERETVVAMIVRFLVWLAITGYAWTRRT
ncbi:MAG: hypothetical protein ABMA64_21765 [Myxococcota bacterium]